MTVAKVTASRVPGLLARRTYVTVPRMAGLGTLLREVMTEVGVDAPLLVRRLAGIPDGVKPTAEQELERRNQQRYVRRWLNGHVVPGMTGRIKIARALGVPPVRLAPEFTDDELEEEAGAATEPAEEAIDETEDDPPTSRYDPLSAQGRGRPDGRGRRRGA